jgi:hypothetical protein
MADDTPPPPPKPSRGRSRATGLVGKPFPKGASPNPGGIPRPGGKVLPRRVRAVLEGVTETGISVEQAIVAAGPFAVRYVVEVIMNDEEATRDRLAAARTIIDKLKANAAPEPKASDEQQKARALDDFVEAIKATPSPPEGGDASG